MRFKSYFSRSVDEALSLAAAELGPDARLVYVRDTPLSPNQPGRTEAVFASLDAQQDGEAAAVRPPSGPHRQAASGQRGLDVAALRAEIAGLLSVVSNSAPAGEPPLPVPAERSRMIREIRTDAVLRRGRGCASLVIFIGPPGAGKTVSIVKLAARQLAQGRPAPWLISFDNRVGGGEPLRSFATALECRFDHFSLAGDVVPVVARAEPDSLIFIDTPGCGPQDENLAGAVGELIRRCPSAEIQLTLSAGMKAADLSAAVERFQTFRPTKLLFTRLDETGTYGPLWSEAVRWNLPVSFLAFGQQIPEDIEPATAVRLADLALRPGSNWLLAKRRKVMGASA